MNGRIFLDRSITQHWIWTNSDRLKWWLDLLMLAAWDQQQIMIGRKRITLERGQIVASISFLCSRWGVCNHTIIDFLKLLEEDEMIHKDTHNNISIITICNYDTYQGVQESDPHNVVHNVAHNAEESEVHREAHNLAHTLNACKSEQIQEQEQTDTHNLAHNVVHNVAHTNKESKINILLSSTTPNAHEKIFVKEIDTDREAALIEELKTQQIWIEDVRRMFHIEQEEIFNRLEEFKLSNRTRDISHHNLGDIKRHFCDWLRIVKSYENNQKQNGNNITTNNRSAAQAQRRQAEVTASSAQSYEGSF